ncbi:MAG: GDSL-type esterase/lipase family protein [Myxococcota bacterium]
MKPLDRSDTDPTGTTSPTSPTSPTVPDTETTPTDSTSTTTTPTGPLTAADCFAGQWGGAPPVDYDQYGLTMGSHCVGTNHQDIQDVERVVFVGDSITVGTPPTPTASWWRNQTADAIATRFGLQPPGVRWRNVSLVDGVALETFSGDFAACAKWGARTDDLIQPPHEQFVTCMPEEDRDLRTLVIMSIGGNDIYSLLEDAQAGVDEATLRQTYLDAVAQLEDAVDWLLEPGRFPNGVYLVFTDTYDFTDPDGAEDMALCDGAQLLGLDEPLRDPVVQSILADAQEAYVRMATETGTDLVFLGEGFCGHGFDRDDPSSRCYRGPGADLYFDLTCEHPNQAGHDAITDMVLRTIDE